MKSSKFLLVIIFLLACLRGIGQNQLSNEEKLYGLSMLWKEIDYNFPYFHRINFNFDSLYQSYIPKVIDAKTKRAYYSELQSFCGSLHEGHTFIYFPQDCIDKGFVQIITEYTEDGFYIIAVGENISNKISLGDKIIEIDDLDIYTYIDSVVMKYNSVPIHCKYACCGDLLFNIPGKTKYKLKLQKLSGAIDIVWVNKNDESSKWKFTEFSPFPLRYKYKYLDDSIAYFKIPSFQNAKPIQDFMEKAEEIKSSKGIIFDIRKNPGGSSFGAYYCMYLTKKDSFHDYDFATRINNSYYRALGAYSDTTIIQKIVGGNPRYHQYAEFHNGNEFEIIESNRKNQADIFMNQPVVVLIDESVASAAETFLITLKNINRAVFVGTPTFGSATQPLVVLLPGGGHARIATQKALYANGEEYNYTKPDFFVRPSIQDYLSGNDPVLKKAIEVIESLSK